MNMEGGISATADAEQALPFVGTSAPWVWTEKAEETLKDLWLAGHSAGAIAKTMGVTRNMVIGKKDRMQLISRAPTVCVIPRKRITQPKIRDYTKARRQRVASQKVPRIRRAQLHDLPEPLGASVGLLALKQSHCRYPVSGDGAEIGFCGHPRTNHSSYCAHHHARCHGGNS